MKKSDEQKKLERAIYDQFLNLSKKKPKKVKSRVPSKSVFLKDFKKLFDKDQKTEKRKRIKELSKIRAKRDNLKQLEKSARIKIKTKFITSVSSHTTHILSAGQFAGRKYNREAKTFMLTTPKKVLPEMLSTEVFAKFISEEYYKPLRKFLNNKKFFKNMERTLVELGYLFFFKMSRKERVEEIGWTNYTILTSTNIDEALAKMFKHSLEKFKNYSSNLLGTELFFDGVIIRVSTLKKL